MLLNTINLISTDNFCASQYPIFSLNRNVFAFPSLEKKLLECRSNNFDKVLDDIERS